MKNIKVQGIIIKIEQINDDDYISLTDIAKKFGKPANLIRNWLRKTDTLGYLAEWERLHGNDDFNSNEYKTILDDFSRQGGSFSISPSQWIKRTNAIGLKSVTGRTGGTYSHSTIAIGFAYWLNPQFQLYFTHAFQELMKREYNRNNLEWHFTKITDNIDEVRNLLDTIPHQNPKRNRLNEPKK